MAGNMWRRTRGDGVRAGPHSWCSLPRRQQESGSARNPLICIRLDLKAKCKIQPSFLWASRSLLKNHQTFRWSVHRRTSDSPRLIPSQEWSQERYNPRKVFPNSLYGCWTWFICSGANATFLHRVFLFINLCQLEFSPACFTLIKLDQNINIFQSTDISWFLSTRETSKHQYPTSLIKKLYWCWAYRWIIPGDYWQLKRFYCRRTNTSLLEL